jgi:hypothetical protein
MAHNPHCDSFPDIWQEVPPKDDPTHATVLADNAVHGKVYQAARHIVVTDFNPSLKIPESPADFPGNPGQLTDAQIAMMATVHGILLADDWEPTMGKSKPATGDLLIDVGGGEKMVVDARFVAAVVAAVQEYTTQAPLFNGSFEQLRQESVQSSPGTQIAQQAQAATSKHQSGGQPANP